MIATTQWTTSRKSRKATWRRVGLLAVLAVALACLLTGGICSALRLAQADGRRQATGLRGFSEGDLAPDFTLTDTAGKTFELSKHAGTTVVILFWAPSNKMSGPALAAFQKLAGKYKSDEAVFVAIREKIEKEKPKDGANSTSGRPARVLPDVDRAVFGKFGIIALPTTLIVSPDGRLAKYIPLYDGRYGAVVEASIGLAEGKITLGQWEAIVHPINRKLDPATLRAARLTRLAGRYSERGSWKMAEESYRKALKQKKRYAPAWLGLGYALLKQNRAEEAIKAFEEVGKEPALRRRRVLGVGIALRRLGKKIQAKEALLQAAKLPPSDGRAYYELGLIAESQNKTKAALNYYRKALSVAFRDE